MMLHVQHTWTFGTRFKFNTYLHWKVVIMRGCADLFHIKEEVTQGEPISSTVYDLWLLPII